MFSLVCAGGKQEELPEEVGGFPVIFLKQVVSMHVLYIVLEFMKHENVIMNAHVNAGFYKKQEVGGLSCQYVHVLRELCVGCPYKCKIFPESPLTLEGPTV